MIKLIYGEIVRSWNRALSRSYFSSKMYSLIMWNTPTAQALAFARSDTWLYLLRTSTLLILFPDGGGILSPNWSTLSLAGSYLGLVIFSSK